MLDFRLDDLLPLEPRRDFELPREPLPLDLLPPPVWPRLDLLPEDFLPEDLLPLDFLPPPDFLLLEPRLFEPLDFLDPEDFELDLLLLPPDFLLPDDFPPPVRDEDLLPLDFPRPDDLPPPPDFEPPDLPLALGDDLLPPRDPPAPPPEPLPTAFAAMAPITPPTTAPTGPATLPTTAPAAAPAVCFDIGGIARFSEDCAFSEEDEDDPEFCSSAIMFWRVGCCCCFSYIVSRFA